MIYLQWIFTITSTYIEWLPLYLLTMQGNNNINLQWKATKASSYNGWLP
jgi:hypothetical protein